MVLKTGFPLIKDNETMTGVGNPWTCLHLVFAGLRAPQKGFPPSATSPTEVCRKKLSPTCLLGDCPNLSLVSPPTCFHLLASSRECTITQRLAFWKPDYIVTKAQLSAIGRGPNQAFGASWTNKGQRVAGGGTGGQKTRLDLDMFSPAQIALASYSEPWSFLTGPVKPLIWLSAMRANGWPFYHNQPMSNSRFQNPGTSASQIWV